MKFSVAQFKQVWHFCEQTGLPAATADCHILISDTHINTIAVRCYLCCCCSLKVLTNMLT